MPKSTDYTAKAAGPDGTIPYDADENAVWRDLMARQMPEVRRHMARAYLDGLSHLNLPADRVPQCAEVSAALAGVTGWRVAPVPALIPFGQFFGLLADRCFPPPPSSATAATSTTSKSLTSFTKSSATPPSLRPALRRLLAGHRPRRPCR